MVKSTTLRGVNGKESGSGNRWEESGSGSNNVTLTVGSIKCTVVFKHLMYYKICEAYATATAITMSVAP